MAKKKESMETLKGKHAALVAKIEAETATIPDEKEYLRINEILRMEVLKKAK